jgi:hypothetical protein
VASKIIMSKSARNPIRPPAISNQATNEKPRPQGSTNGALNLEVSQHPEKLGRSRERLGRKSIKAMAGGKLEPSQSCDGTVGGSGGLTPRREAPRQSPPRRRSQPPRLGPFFGLVFEMAPAPSWWSNGLSGGPTRQSRRISNESRLRRPAGRYLAALIRHFFR